MFPIIADNMISKPFIDTRDIPLYEVLLQSPRPEVQNNFLKWLYLNFKFRSVCAWELQLLCDGLRVTVLTITFIANTMSYHISCVCTCHHC